MISLGWVKVCGVEHHVSHLDRDGIRGAGLDQVTLDPKPSPPYIPSPLNISMALKIMTLCPKP